MEASVGGDETASAVGLGRKKPLTLRRPYRPMLVTDRFVFVHLPRSGGTFVSQVIQKVFPEAHEVGYHLPLSALPAEFSHLPVLGTVRNPWDFYVSWYHHQESND